MHKNSLGRQVSEEGGGESYSRAFRTERRGGIKQQVREAGDKGGEADREARVDEG